MKIEVSNGELIDKYTILGIKLEKIKDEEKLSNVSNEYNILEEFVQFLFNKYNFENYDLYSLYLELLKINNTLWDIEDKIRECERRDTFGKEFVSLARLVYITNDKRSDLKKQINIITNSSIIEEKSYHKY